MKLIKAQPTVDKEDLDIILCESLINTDGAWYDLTFEQALLEQSGGLPLLYCEYVIDYQAGTKVLTSFVGWTKDAVIFSIIGIGVPDTLLDSVKRNPVALEDRIT